MNTANLEHIPVLSSETIENLITRTDGIYVDATFGRGGHAREMLHRLNSQSELLVIDKDPQAILAAKSIADSRLKIAHGSFTRLKELANSYNWVGKINGILLDLGVSSPQLDDAKRGFSFLRDGPLDMRMDTSQKLTAGKWLNSALENEIAEVLKRYGEERFNKKIARAIVRERSKKPISTTGELAALVSRTNPKWEKHKHPATRVFQALRIFINDELEELKECLNQCLDILAPSGRLLVLSFHSLEDRIIKDFIKKNSGRCILPREVPIKYDSSVKRLNCIGHTVRTKASEVDFNPRARSAKLRIMEKI